MARELNFEHAITVMIAAIVKEHNASPYGDWIADEEETDVNGALDIADPENFGKWLRLLTQGIDPTPMIDIPELVKKIWQHPAGKSLRKTT